MQVSAHCMSYYVMPLVHAICVGACPFLLPSSLPVRLRRDRLTTAVQCMPAMVQVAPCVRSYLPGFRYLLYLHLFPLSRLLSHFSASSRLLVSFPKCLPLAWPFASLSVWLNRLSACLAGCTMHCSALHCTAGKTRASCECPQCRGEDCQGRVRQQCGQQL